MLRKLTIVIILILSISLISGCGKSNDTAAEKTAKTVSEVPAGPGPSSTDPKGAAETILKFKESKDWNKLYDYVYVDIQKTISREDFVAYNSKSKVSYANHKVVGEPKIIPEWVDKIDGVTYKNVAEVSYTADIVTPRGKVNFKNQMYLIQTPEKNWRYIWIKK